MVSWRPVPRKRKRGREGEVQDRSHGPCATRIDFILFLLPIPIPTFRCCALPKLAVCAVSLSICITCGASPKLIVLILCGLSMCAPGYTPFYFISISLIRVPQYWSLAHFKTWQEQLAITVTTSSKCAILGLTPPAFLLIPWVPELRVLSRLLKAQGSRSLRCAFPGC